MSDYCTDVVIHIDEELEDAYIHEIERDMANMEGVYSACVNDKARHLLLVDYDPITTDSGQLLQNVQSHGLHAELVGL